jgi:3-hydroxyisobutyrate dehydrogenase
VAFDLRPEAVDAAVRAGAQAAGSAREAAAGADVLITVLPGQGQIEAVLLGDDGALAALPKGAVAIDMSTSAPELGRRLADAAAERGVAFLDAPVADALRAPEGMLNIFVGGAEADVARARPVLEAMGDPERIVHVGPTGAGYMVKRLVNLQWFVHAAAAAEAMVVGVRAGIDLRKLYGALATGPASSSFLRNEALEVLEDGEYGERFPLGLVSKDLDITLRMIDETGVRTELSALTRRLYADALERYGAQAGEMAVLRLYEDSAGVELRFGSGDGA